MNTLKDFFGRLGRGWVWIAAQFGGTLLLILAALGWTRLPDKHGWQVLLSLLIPLLLAISALELEAGTMRRFADDDGKRVKLVWGAATLLVWIAVGWLAWSILDWCDDQIPQWTGYLNSKASAHARATVLTYAHIQRWLTLAEWVCRWIVVPAKIVPYAMASVQWGWRLPWRRVLRLLWNWQWWLGVAVAALLGAWLPGSFFAKQLSGTPRHQVWTEGFRLGGAYLLAVVSWVLVLGWAAALFARQKPLAETDLDAGLFRRLTASRAWVWALFVCVLLWQVSNRMPSDHMWQVRVWQVLPVVLFVAGLYFQAKFVRSLLSGEGKPVRLIWGAVAPLVWAVAALAFAFLIDLLPLPAFKLLAWWVIVPALLVPFAAVSAQWGLRLPWRRVLRMLGDWRWWLGVVSAAIVGVALPALILITTAADPDAGTPAESGWTLWFKLIVVTFLRVGAWVMLLGWVAVLFGRQNPPSEESLVAVPVASGPPERELGAQTETPPTDESAQV